MGKAVQRSNGLEKEEKEREKKRRRRGGGSGEKATYRDITAAASASAVIRKLQREKPITFFTRENNMKQTIRRGKQAFRARQVLGLVLCV
jgi:hypothetical protein